MRPDEEQILFRRLVRAIARNHGKLVNEDQILYQAMALGSGPVAVDKLFGLPRMRCHHCKTSWTEPKISIRKRCPHCGRHLFENDAELRVNAIKPRGWIGVAINGNMSPDVMRGMLRAGYLKYARRPDMKICADDVLLIEYCMESPLSVEEMSDMIGSSHAALWGRLAYGLHYMVYVKCFELTSKGKSFEKRNPGKGILHLDINPESDTWYGKLYAVPRRKSFMNGTCLKESPEWRRRQGLPPLPKSGREKLTV